MRKVGDIEVSIKRAEGKAGDSQIPTFHDADRKQITALAGLDPVQRNQGYRRGKSRMSTQGNAQLRKMLFSGYPFDSPMQPADS